MREDVTRRRAEGRPELAARHPKGHRGDRRAKKWGPSSLHLPGTAAPPRPRFLGPGSFPGRTRRSPPRDPSGPLRVVRSRAHSSTAPSPSSRAHPCRPANERTRTSTPSSGPPGQAHGRRLRRTRFDLAHVAARPRPCSRLGPSPLCGPLGHDASVDAVRGRARFQAGPLHRPVDDARDAVGTAHRPSGPVGRNMGALPTGDRCRFADHPLCLDVRALAAVEQPRRGLTRNLLAFPWPSSEEHGLLRSTPAPGRDHPRPPGGAPVAGKRSWDRSIIRGRSHFPLLLGRTHHPARWPALSARERNHDPGGHPRGDDPLRATRPAAERTVRRADDEPEERGPPYEEPGPRRPERAPKAPGRNRRHSRLRGTRGPRSSTLAHHLALLSPRAMNTLYESTAAENTRRRPPPPRSRRQGLGLPPRGEEREVNPWRSPGYSTAASRRSSHTRLLKTPATASRRGRKPPAHRDRDQIVVERELPPVTDREEGGLGNRYRGTQKPLLQSRLDRRGRFVEKEPGRAVEEARAPRQRAAARELERPIPGILPLDQGSRTQASRASRISWSPNRPCPR